MDVIKRNLSLLKIENEKVVQSVQILENEQNEQERNNIKRETTLCYLKDNFLRRKSGK